MTTLACRHQLWHDVARAYIPHQPAKTHEGNGFIHGVARSLILYEACEQCEFLLTSHAAMSCDSRAGNVTAKMLAGLLQKKFVP